MKGLPIAGGLRQCLLGILAGGLLASIAIAGADHPPPPAFMVLLVGIAGWTAVVSFTRWPLRTRPRRLQLGATAGVGAASCAVIGLAVSALGTADRQAALADQAWIGGVVAMVLAAAGASALAVASWLVVDRAP